MLKRFAHYYKPYLAWFLMDLACALCISLVDLAYPLVSKYALNTLLPQGAYRTFFVWMGRSEERR